MSLIHDALRKAESGRTPSGPIDPASLLRPPPGAPRIRMKNVLMLAGLLILLLGTAAGLAAVVFPGFLGVQAGPAVPLARPEAPPIPETAEKAPPPPPEPQEPPTPVPTTPLFVLHGIVHGEGEPFAVINNQITRLGEDVDGAILSEIGEESVFLETEGERLRLKLK